MLYESLGIALAISNIVSAEAALQHGNLSTIVNSTPAILAVPTTTTTTTTTAAGLGGYILAGLGRKAALNNSTTIRDPGTARHYSSSQASTAPLVCYTMTTQCWSDVFYTSPSIASTGSGSAYATQCSNALSSYSSASTSWTNKHNYVENYTQVVGGSTWLPVTYYANASTLCDGHARVTQSPAVVLSSTTITTVLSTPTTSIGTQNAGWMFPISTPSCSINPSDCDGLWKAYSTSSSKWAAAANGTSAKDAIFPTITPSPSIPPCVNSSQSSDDASFSSSFYGCGPCTIYGNEVQLVYFPVPSTVSRDMCATTPSAKLTRYGENVGVPYTGADPAATWHGFNNSLEVATLNGHTFTSGTAYISIKTVWAEDRCSTTLGTKVTDAILALPSSELLSLRYRQDHFQYFAITDKQTGYPFNFADLNTPIPYSAWNGQQACSYLGAPYCNVIYENDYNPQLAMPPGIRKLNPAWDRCQMWYGGLYDPPYALQPGTAVATPTLPFMRPAKTSAAPSPFIAATTPTPTALAVHTTDESGSTDTAGNNLAANQPSQPEAGAQGAGTDSQNPQNPQADGSNLQNAQGGGSNTQNSQAGDSNTQDSQIDGSSPQPDGQQHGDQDSNNGGGIVRSGDVANQNNEASQHVFVFTAGTTTYTATSFSTVIVCGTNTLAVGGPAATLAGGYVISAGANGLVLGNTPKTLAIPKATAGSQNAVTFNVGSTVATASGASGKNNVAVIGGSMTVSAGGPEQTLAGGNTVSLAEDGAILVDSTSAAAIPVASGADEVYTVNGTPLTVHGAASGTGAFIINDGPVISRDGPAVTLSNGLVVSLGSDGIVAEQGTSIVPPTAFTSASAASSTASTRSGSRTNTAVLKSGTQQQSSTASSTASASSTSKGTVTKVSSSQMSLVISVVMFSPLLLAIYL